ncbi:acyl-CoA synthetase family member 2 [Megachile rotundata]|uniref:acyl-CoA synthetase family member 2 n=1 Tax=Megachile rotundata TaxID=143995 RepID=UPI003FD407A8
MLRWWYTKNPLSSIVGYHVSRVNVSNAERLLFDRCRVERSVSSQHKRFSHDQRQNVAHMARGGEDPLTQDTIGILLERAAERWPNEECVVSVHQNVRLTFSECLRRADRLAAGLTKLGMKRGDRLGIWGPNHVEWLLSIFCAARAGFVVVAINPTYQMNEITYCLQKVGVKAVISPATFKMQNYPQMLLEARQTCPTLEHIIIHSDDHVTGTHRFKDVENLASRIEVERVAGQQNEISCREGTNIQFTSGTTGKPKAALLSHWALVNNARQAAKRSQFEVGHKACLSVPFFHAFGIIKGVLSSLNAGITLVLPAPSFNPVKSLDAIVGEKCNVVYGTPTMWINILDVHQRLQPPPITLFCGVTGGSPASPELFRKIRECFHFDNIKTIYGLTETAAVIFQSLPNEDHHLTENTVGHLANHVEALVVDENGTPVPMGSPGELWIRGYCNMNEYWGDEKNTRKTLTEDGWLKTGDQFILRSDGYGQIIGRLKDMLIRGGENIFPKEVEDLLMTHPLVVEAQVISAYDKVYGEEICACVRLKEGASLTREQLKDYCKGRIAPFKIPRYVEFVGEYPKTASGKVMKYVLKQNMERAGVIPATPTSA